MSKNDIVNKLLSDASEIAQNPSRMTNAQIEKHNTELNQKMAEANKYANISFGCTVVSGLSLGGLTGVLVKSFYQALETGNETAMWLTGAGASLSAGATFITTGAFFFHGRDQRRLARSLESERQTPLPASIPASKVDLTL